MSRLPKGFSWKRINRMALEGAKEDEVTRENILKLARYVNKEAPKFLKELAAFKKEMKKKRKIKK